MNDQPKTITVPEAGMQYFGMSRNASYAAAHRGEIPTIKIGKLLRVPVRTLEEMLDRTCAKMRSGSVAA
jgi:helix-turn-helix protein